MSTIDGVYLRVSIIVVVYYTGLFIIVISIKGVVYYIGCLVQGISIIGVFIIELICYRDDYYRGIYYW